MGPSFADTRFILALSAEQATSLLNLTAHPGPLKSIWQGSGVGRRLPRACFMPRICPGWIVVGIQPYRILVLDHDSGHLVPHTYRDTDKTSCYKLSILRNIRFLAETRIEVVCRCRNWFTLMLIS